MEQGSSALIVTRCYYISTEPLETTIRSSGKSCFPRRYKAASLQHSLQYGSKHTSRAIDNCLDAKAHLKHRKRQKHTTAGIR